MFLGFLVGFCRKVRRKRWFRRSKRAMEAKKANIKGLENKTGEEHYKSFAAASSHGQIRGSTISRSFALHRTYACLTHSIVRAGELYRPYISPCNHHDIAAHQGCGNQSYPQPPEGDTGPIRSFQDKEI